MLNSVSPNFRELVFSILIGFIGQKVLDNEIIHVGLVHNTVFYFLLDV